MPFKLNRIPSDLVLEISDTLKRIGNTDGAIRIALAQEEQSSKNVDADPANTRWQRDLSVSHSKLGDLRRARGEAAAAEESYAASLATAKRLVAMDPANTVWQRDLSVCHSKQGDLRRARGETAAAEESYVASLAIRERLTAMDPANTGLQRDLGIIHRKLEILRRARGEK